MRSAQVEPGRGGDDGEARPERQREAEAEMHAGDGGAWPVTASQRSRTSVSSRSRRASCAKTVWAMATIPGEI